MKKNPLLFVSTLSCLSILSLVGVANIDAKQTIQTKADETIEIDGLGYIIENVTEKTMSLVDASTFTGEELNLSTVTYSDEEYKVVSIGPNAFDGCTSIKILNMPEVKYVMCDSFDELTNLEEIYLNKADYISFTMNGCANLKVAEFNAVTNLSDNFFENLTSLERVKAINCTQLSTDCFSGCTSLEEVDFPMLSSISGACFKNTTSLKKVVFPRITSTLPDSCFEGSGIEEVVLPELTQLGNGAFKNCTSLKTVSLNKCQYSSGNAFEGCTALESISLPSFANCGASEFEGCTALKYVDLPNLNYTGAEVFKNCTSLKSVSLPSISFLGNNLFAGCTALESLYFENLIQLEEGQIDGATNLKTLFVSYKNFDISNESLDSVLSALDNIYVPMGTKDSFISMSNREFFSKVNDCGYHIEAPAGIAVANKHVENNVLSFVLMKSGTTHVNIVAHSSVYKTDTVITSPNSFYSLPVSDGDFIRVSIDAHNAIDEDKNHVCDICSIQTSGHTDADNDHVCEYCGGAASGHVDANLDNKCDICGEFMNPNYTHSDVEYNSAVGFSITFAIIAAVIVAFGIVAFVVLTPIIKKKTK